MRKLTLLLVLLSHTFYLHAETPSLPRHLSTCEGIPGTIIGGCVNAITGDFVEGEADLQTTGPRPFTVGRYFCNAKMFRGSLCDGWNYFHHHHAAWMRSDAGFRWSTASTSWGTVARFFGNCTKQFQFEGQNGMGLCPYTIAGLTNYTTDLPTAQRNLTSTKIRIDNMDLLFTMVEGSGVRRKFTRFNKGGINPSADYVHFRLAEQINPDGSKIDFSGQKNDLMRQIRLSDHTGSQSWGEVTFTYGGNKKTPSDLPTHIETETGDWVRYDYVKKGGWLISQVDRWDGKSTSYEYLNRNGTPLISQKRWGDNRYLGLDYYRVGHNAIMGKDVHLRDEENPRVNRVLKVEAPIGKDGERLTAYRFVYDWKKERRKGKTELVEGYTHVYDALDNSTTFVYDAKDRLTGVTKYRQTPSGYKAGRSDRIYYKRGGDTVETWVRNHAIFHEGKAVHCRTFDYDDRGNVIQETLYGILTGNRQVTPSLQYTGDIQGNGCESYPIYRRYSTCGRNLLVEESEPNGKKVQFTYFPNTDLPTSKIEMEGGHVILRTFFEYDEHYLLVAKIEDDGTALAVNDLTGVTTRRIQRLNYLDAPIVGLPKITTDLYLDVATGQEIQLKRVERNFNHRGQVLLERTYDANDDFVFEVESTYTPIGQLASRIDSRGTEEHFEYDVQHNLTRHEQVHLGLITRHGYDAMDRKIWSVVEGSDGLVVEERTEYDLMGRPVVIWDHQNNPTYQVFDESDRIIEQTLPALLLPSGTVVHPIKKMAYDVDGNVTRETDPLGGTTQKAYNCRGQVLSTTHPDGTRESLTYAGSGAPVAHVHVDGSTTRFEFDPFNRKQRETLTNAAGTVLADTSYVYKGSNLTEQRELNGKTTLYEYDGAGRKACVRVLNGALEQKTDFTYNAQGLVAQQREWLDADHYRATSYEYDLFGHVVQETVEDEMGTILRKVESGYDLAGNNIADITFNADGNAQITSRQYDALGRILKEVDPEGNTTYFEYNHHGENELGQLVLVITRTDALGYQTVTQHDALGRPCLEEKINPFGVLVQSTKTWYDAKGQKIQQDHRKFFGNEEETPYTIQWAYDSCGRLIQETEASGTPDARTTYYVHDPENNIEKMVRPDGTDVLTEKDVLERVLRLSASDLSFDYRYTYDDGGNLVAVADLITQTTTCRTYDGLNRLIAETLSNGLTVKFDHDALDRTTSLTLPDNSQIEYRFDAAHLRNVIRKDSSENTLYSYSADAYDPSGRLLEATLPGQAGPLTVKLDAKGRLIEKTAPQWIERVETGGWDPISRLLKTTIQDPSGTHDFAYEYDDLDQVKRELGPFEHQYAYDSLYNLREEDGATQIVDPLNQLKGKTGHQYAYSACGELLQDNHTHFTYDALGRLVKVEEQSCRIEYTYDPFHRRISERRYQNDALTHQFLYLYQGDNEIGQTDQHGQLRQLRILKPSRNADIGSAIALEFQDQIFVPIHDLRGNLACLIDAATGTVAETCLYSAFGQRKITSDDNVADNPWHFSSKRYDDQTQLYLFGRRYYSIEMKRWTTPDPLRFADGPNLFAYVKNRPTIANDLYGYITAQGVGRALGMARSGYHVFQASYSLLQSTGDTINMALGNGCRYVLPPYGNPTVDCPGFEAPFRAKSCCFDLSGEAGFHALSRGGISIVNGIDTNFDEAMDHARYLGRLAGGTNILGVHNATHGMYWDLIECALNLFHYLNTSPVQRLHDQWNNFFENADPDVPLLHFCHSQGAILTRNALMSYPEHLRKRIQVVAIAPGAYIDESLCQSVIHYRVPTIYDGIPYCDLPKAFRNSRNVKTLFPEEGQQKGFHGFQHPIYERHITRHLTQYRKTYG